MTSFKELVRSAWSVVEEVGMTRSVVRLIDITSPGFIRFHGYRIATEGLSHKVKGALFWGFYESAELTFIQRHLRADIDVIELGTSIGVVACHILSRISSRKRLICVEASPQLVPLAALNIASNHPDRRFELLNCALSYGSDSVHFTESSNSLEGKISESGIEVPTVGLSDLLARFCIEEYALICDVEGAEAQILRYDALALARCRQLIIELHDSGDASARDLEDVLTRTCGFRVVERYETVLVLLRSDPNSQSGPIGVETVAAGSNS